MTRMLAGWIPVLAALALTGASFIDVEVKSDEKALVVTAMGDIYRPMFDRVASYVSDNCWSPCRRKELAAAETDSAESLMAALTASRGPNDVLVLGLMDVPGEFREQVDVSRGVALLNIRPFRSADLETDKDAEKHGRLVE